MVSDDQKEKDKDRYKIFDNIMGNLSKNLSRWEVRCKCGCGKDTIDTETTEVYQECVDHFIEVYGKLLIAKVTSGHRCKIYNEVVGGGVRSQHLKGRAIDFTIIGVPPQDVYSYLVNKYPDRYGIGSYKKFTHLDTRSGPPRRW